MCETKPVPGLRIRDGVAAGRPLRPAARACRAGCTNKPNFAGRARTSAGEICKTNPIPDRRDTPAFHCPIIPPCYREAGWDEGRGVEDEGTKRAKRTQFAPAGQVRGAVAGANHAKRTQYRKESQVGRVKCAERSQFREEFQAGSVQCQAKRAKQTQSAEADRRWARGSRSPCLCYWAGDSAQRTQFPGAGWRDLGCRCTEQSQTWAG
jgi:hypothetical protein